MSTINDLAIGDVFGIDFDEAFVTLLVQLSGLLLRQFVGGLELLVLCG